MRTKPLFLLAFVIAPAVACTAGRTTLDGGVLCPQASLTFVMEGAPFDVSRWCVGSDCSLAWLTIIDPNGVEHVLDHPCDVDCDTCEPVGCPANCPLPTLLPATGVQRAWSGTYFSQGVCGVASLCSASTCALAGHYVAKMCAHRSLTVDATSSSCSGEATATCVEVPFDWPPAAGVTTVTGFVGASYEGDAGPGACCPTAWTMYACHWPDGAEGLNCHNPAMGCASSETCGGGCDSAVTGRCGE